MLSQSLRRVGARNTKCFHRAFSTKPLDDYFKIKRMSPEGISLHVSLTERQALINQWNNTLDDHNRDLCEAFARWTRREGDDLGVDPIKSMGLEQLDEEGQVRAKIIERTEEEKKKAEEIDRSDLSTLLSTLSSSEQTSLSESATSAFVSPTGPFYHLYVKAQLRPERKVVIGHDDWKNDIDPKIIDEMKKQGRTIPEQDHPLSVISKYLTTETDAVLLATPPLDDNQEVEPSALPDEIKMLIRKDYAEPITKDEVEEFERQVIKGGKEAAMKAKNITGVEFFEEAVSVDPVKLGAFVKEVEGNAKWCMEEAKKMGGEIDSMYSYPIHVGHLCEMIRLSNLPTPNFDSLLVADAPKIGTLGNMKAVAFLSRYIAAKKLAVPEFWSLISQNPEVVCMGATSSEAATIAKALMDIDHDIPAFFKELVANFDPAKDDDEDSNLEYGADPNYLIPSTHPDIPYTNANGDRFVTRRHFTTPRDMASFASSFAHFKYDSPALFGKCIEHIGEWDKGEEGKVIRKALKDMGYSAEAA